MRYFVASFLAILFFGVPWTVQNYPNETGSFLSIFGDPGNEIASIILAHNPKTVALIQAKYAAATPTGDKKVRILLVPGHEPNDGGTEYKDLKEREMAVELTNDLQSFLSSNPKFTIVRTRDADGSWDPIFSNYFSSEWDDIIAWQKASHDEMSRLIALGSTTIELPKVIHANAKKDVALRLYGITKWSNENDIDIVIHVHFNNDTVHGWNKKGAYSGFAIYVPAVQYLNSTTTKAIATSIYGRLAAVDNVSNFPGESSGIVDEPDLIAVGANNTADAASMLIEYGYIYENQFADPASRARALHRMAYATYLGLQDFFNLPSISNPSSL